MKPLGDLRRHYWLATRMAQTAGAELAEATREGRLAQEDWAEAVERCRGCGWSEGCARWLEHNESVETAPSNCLNRDLFAALGAGEPAP